MEQWNVLCNKVVERIIDALVKNDLTLEFVYFGWGVELHKGDDFAIERAVNALNKLEEYELKDELEKLVEIYF